MEVKERTDIPLNWYIAYFGFWRKQTENALDQVSL